MQIRHAALCSVLSLLTMVIPVWAGGRSDRLAEVDKVYHSLRQGIASRGLAEVLEIDHCRLAEQAGVTMPPARVALFADSEINSRLLRQNIRVGLDLPFRVLAYEGKTGPSVVYTGAQFLQVRHGLSNSEALDSFDRILTEALAGLNVTTQPAPVPSLGKDYGITELESAYGYKDTFDRLKAAVTSQSDTIWFGEIDFTAEAAKHGIALNPVTLLLFGGPAPGGVAMDQFQRIGLDAFCQKLLVYQDIEGRIHVIFNSIKALAELHYGKSATPHQALDRRLSSTFRKAIGSR